MIKVIAKFEELYKANLKDSGFDLKSSENVKIRPLMRKVISTGIYLDMRDFKSGMENVGIECQVRPRSGNAFKKGLTVLNTPGTIDQYYTGEIKVILYNTSDKIINIEKGDRVAQLVFSPVFNSIDIKYVNNINISKNIRGSKGFGSSGE